MKLTKEQILSIEKKRNERTEGHLKTNKQIAKELGVSEMTVIRWVKRLRESGRNVEKRSGGFEKINLK